MKYKGQKKQSKTNRAVATSSALYPGSFDPVTRGHVDVIERLSQIFSPVYVIVADSPRKTYSFNRTERVDLMRSAVKHIPNVEVIASAELTVNVARDLGSNIIARSVRTVGDWEYEYAMAFANKKLAPEIETFFIMADPELGFISSSLVREVALFDGDVSKFVTKNVSEALKKKKKGR